MEESATCKVMKIKGKKGHEATASDYNVFTLVLRKGFLSVFMATTAVVAWQPFAKVLVTGSFGTKRGFVKCP